ncbi:hypothetical protein AGMMS50268_28650 [Spirochaetia bacterium]|nr:hypothetical protein AGMMS50268_28650 [Spirochaetia bacterium]
MRKIGMMKNVGVIVLFTVLLAACETTPVMDEFGIPVNKAGDFKITVDRNYISIDKYVGTATEVSIPATIKGKPVEFISEEAFMNKGLTHVTIPDTILVIYDRAFKDNKLRSVTIPDGVSKIRESAFENNQLAEVIISNHVESIGNYAFAGNNLSSLPQFNPSAFIGEGAFSRNNFDESDLYKDYTWTETDGGITITGYSGNSRSIQIPGAINSLPVKVIAKNSFSYKDLVEVTIPGTVETIEDEAFSDNVFQRITIGRGVKKIGRRAFYFATANEIWVGTQGKELAQMYDDFFIDIGANVEVFEDSFNYFFTEIAYIPNNRNADTYRLERGGRWHAEAAEMLEASRQLYRRSIQ